jgi:hypothetical protein
MSHLLQRDETYAALAGFPGPLSNSVNSSLILKYINDFGSAENATNPDSVLLWNFLRILVQENGDINSPDKKKAHQAIKALLLEGIQKDSFPVIFLSSPHQQKKKNLDGKIECRVT